MTELCAFPVASGFVTEIYSVTHDDDGLMIHCVRDTDDIRTADVMHIAHDAAVRVAIALLRGVGEMAAAPVHVAFPTNVVPIRCMGVVR
jgi:hypothetical protein